MNERQEISEDFQEANTSPHQILKTFGLVWNIQYAIGTSGPATELTNATHRLPEHCCTGNSESSFKVAAIIAEHFQLKSRLFLN